MSEKPEPKFKKGQVVAIKNSKKNLLFKILEVRFFKVSDDDPGEWAYKWNRNNWAFEHMIRALTPEEIDQ